MGKITINGKTCEFKDGEYVLQIARANGIFIPAICYLNGCSPTLACRLCMADVDGKRAYTCNAKAKDGMVVVTNSQEIAAERKAIMQVYCINHPLECGVCDKSGECELQNFTTYMKVDEQVVAIEDSHKPVVEWGKVSYDPALCIMCERCITVCNDKIGEGALVKVNRAAKQVPKEWKDKLPKDAFMVWGKMQKSLIGAKAGENLDCSQCGECTSVCPVGALVGTKFKYSSNAWELKRVPASNPHSSDCELIYYDVKETGSENMKQKIYRVSNDFHFAEINTAARFGFDFNKEDSIKDLEVFNKIVEGIKNKEIQTIKFNSFITNEEAYLLELLREKFDLNLVNSEAKNYQEFLNIYSQISGKTLYNGNYEDISKSDFVICAGSFLRYDSPNTSYKMNNALKIAKAAGVYFHHINDELVSAYSKNLLNITHNPNIDVEILQFILNEFADDKLPAWAKADTAALANKIGFDLEAYKGLKSAKERVSLIIGEDFYLSKNSETLAKLLGLITKYTQIKTIMIPPRTNSLGVSLLCKLTNETKGKVLGYNEDGDISFGVLECDLDAPALNQQEGTFTNIDKRVVPTNAAIAYKGYELVDIANELLNERVSHVVAYTSRLSSNTHFNRVRFDDLTNYYSNSGVNHRGYILNETECKNEIKEFKIENKNSIDKNFIYLANPIDQFSKFTNYASELTQMAALYISDEYSKENSLEENSLVKVCINEQCSILRVKIDKNIKNSAVYLPYFDEKIVIADKFINRFMPAQISKAE